MDGFTTYRRDRSISGGGIILYIRDDIPATLLNTETYIEGLYVEINVRKKKWLIGCSYNPHKTFISANLKEIGKNVDTYSSRYDNFILLGDVNTELKNNLEKISVRSITVRILLKEIPALKIQLINPALIYLYML